VFKVHLPIKLQVGFQTNDFVKVIFIIMYVIVITILRCVCDL